MAAAGQRRVRSKSPVVRRIPIVRPPTFVPFPGHEGPRPQLSFVLKTLAGDDSGMTEMHLSTPRSWRNFEEEEIYNKILADPLYTRIARNSMIAMMRYLADLWIDSGKSGEGENRIDNPSRRNVMYLPPSETPRIVLKVDPHDESLISGWNAFSIPVGLSISHLFYQLVGNEARWPEIHEDGTQSLKELVFGFTTENEHPENRVVLHQFGMKVAMYWFAKLLDSPFSRQLARCDDCETYFAYERAPRREIRSGVHCGNCKAHGSAKRMESTRNNRTKKMVEFAADVLASWKPSSRRSSRSKWIAEQVNHRTESIRVKMGKQKRSHYPVITGRWVTEHVKQIEAEVERRKYAKS